MTLDIPLFGYVFVGYFVLSLSYPLAVKWHLGKYKKLKLHLKNGQESPDCRWNKNVLNFSVFMPLFFSPAVALFSSIIAPWFISRRGSFSTVEIMIGIVLCILGLLAAREDIYRKPLEPYFYCGGKDESLVERENRLRVDIHDIERKMKISRSKIGSVAYLEQRTEASIVERLKRLDELTKASKLEDRWSQVWVKETAIDEKKKEEKEKDIRSSLERMQKRIEEYKEDVRSQDSSWGRDGSGCALISLFLNYVAGATTAVIFWYFTVAGFSEIRINSVALAAGMALLYFWLPFRYYKEWYTNFYSVDLRRFFAFWFVLLVAIFSFALFSYFNAGLALKGLSASVVAVLSVVGVIERIKPQWYHEGLFPILEELPPRWWIAGALLVFVVLLAIMNSLFLSSRI